MIQMPETMPTEIPEGLVRFVITLTGPKGTHDLEVPGMSGPEAAARRAFFQYVHAGYGDLDDVTILAVVVGTLETV